MINKCFHFVKKRKHGQIQDFVEEREGDFHKISRIFLGRPKWFSQRSCITIKPYFDKNFSAKSQFLKEKQAKIAVFGYFKKILNKKLRFFVARSSSL